MDNGYKVYWEDGAQISEPIDGEIIAEVNSTDFADIKKYQKEEELRKGLYNVIGPDFDDLYK